MRVTVIHNPSAGTARWSPQDLLEAIQREGHETRYRSTKLDRWRAELESSVSADLVVAAGGDGTVDKVGAALAGRGVPMAILPLGTANNIAHALGMSSDVEALVAGWATARRRPFDVGLVHGGGDAHRFLESVGVGLFPDTMAKRKRQHSGDFGEEALGRDLACMLETVAVAPPTPWRIELDGRDLSGEHLAIEAMNIGTLGPMVPLAAQADPGDGLLDVVVVSPSARRALAEHLERRLRHEDHALDLPVVRGRQLVFYGGVSNVHVDGRLMRAKTVGSRMLTVHVGVWTHALDVLV